MLNRHIDVRAYNRDAWNHQVESGNEWTVPVSPEVVAEAREGRWQVVLTASRPVPREWFPEMPSRDVLCLACGGGQQGPIFAAAGPTSPFSTIRRGNWPKIVWWLSAMG